MKKAKAEQPPTTPPNPGGHERKPNGFTLRKSNSRGKGNKHQVRRQKDATTDLSHGIPVAGDPIPPRCACDVVQESVVQDYRSTKTHVRNDVKKAANKVVLSFYNVEGNGGNRPERAEHANEATLEVCVIRNPSQHRQQEQLQEHRNRYALGKERLRGDGPEQAKTGNHSVFTHRTLGESGEVRANQHRCNRRDECGVGPVIQSPAEDFASRLPGSLV